ncbi:hypothetical protein VA249_40540 [Vibrio alfacsensis]|uniref:PEP-CTERM sorting domain-containing protein n=1 Tax=Vibrio alfacsensis TaxID=1074311 RepID=UPI001BEE1698|nr:PEP-CTERM sorting domain-containing protein [Vibrio alfacsensis]BBM67408.1 hypothetical protein VA249_40540 [Vibrio alfacsensis]
MRSNKFLMLATIGIFTSFSANATFIGDSSGGLWDYDAGTNSSTFIGDSGTMFDIALDPISSALYGVSGNGNLYEINQTDASTTLVGDTNSFINGLTFGSDGTLYGSGGGNLFSINTSNAATSVIGSGSYSSSGDIAFDDMGNLFLSSTTGPNNSLWLIDEMTGSGTEIGDIGFDNVYGLNYTDGTLYGFTLGAETIAIDTSTGEGSLLFQNQIRAYGADGAGGVDIPEPSSLVLLGLGVLGLGAWRRKRQ